jgi:hypothetical protein
MHEHPIKHGQKNKTVTAALFSGEHIHRLPLYPDNTLGPFPAVGTGPSDVLDSVALTSFCAAWPAETMDANSTA